MRQFTPLYDGLLFVFLEKGLSDRYKEKAKVIESGVGEYDKDGILIPNRFSKNDVIMVYRRDCVQIDSDHYTIRERDIV